MAGVGLGGFFNGDPNPNPFTDILPPGGALLGANGEPIVDDPTINTESFGDDEGYDPPTGNGLLGTSRSGSTVIPEFKPGGIVVDDLKRRFSTSSKLDQLKFVEENIRDLLFERRKLLNELRAERDEIEKRLNVADIVTDSLDEIFPDILEREIESGVIDER